MRRSLTLPSTFGVALALAACSAGQTTPLDGSATTTTAEDAGVTTTGGHDAGATTIPDAGTTVVANDAGAGSVTYSLTPFTLQPGDEKLYCQYVPPSGTDRWINSFATTLSPGSHHLLIFRVKDDSANPQPTGPVDCLDQDFPPGVDGLLPGGQQLYSEVTLPDGIAMKLAADEGLSFQEHYINATQEPITTAIQWRITTVPAATVTQQAGMIFYSNYGLSVPPGVSHASMTCKAPSDLKLLTSSGHMHRRATDFTALVGGANVYETKSWDEPDGTVFPAPGYAVKQGDPIEWTCTYDNTSTTTYTYGNSAIDNEMCIYIALFYPSTNSGTEFLCQQ